MYTLFGVCHDKCTKKTQEAVKQTEESLLQIINAQTTVVKSTIKKIGNTYIESNRTIIQNHFN